MNQIRIEYLVPELNNIEAEIKGGLYRSELPALSDGVSWGGADVIISDRPTALDVRTVVITPNAAEVGWFFNRIRDVAFEANLMDSNSKLAFYRHLGQCVIRFHLDSEAASMGAEELLLALLSTVREIGSEWDWQDSG